MTSSAQQKAVPIHLFIIHRFISLEYYQNINDCIIFQHFFSVGIEMNCYGYAIILIIYTEYEIDIIKRFTE